MKCFIWKLNGFEHFRYKWRAKNIRPKHQPPFPQQFLSARSSSKSLSLCWLVGPKTQKFKMWQNLKLKFVKPKNVTNSKCDKTPKTNMWLNWKTQNGTTKRPKVWRNSKCDKTQKLKKWQNSKTQNVTKLRTNKKWHKT